ncbi:S49 family peptidase [Deinococcus hopiensis]|uniref:Signal peptide peptidase SppA n=1 Tax=Deinococcus hopiensis KR-140 TaxID=695939 RepID=A0A1W1UXK0_9DEIO|nr:S49 family peptidase [Deinococcus hopiensis]SMB85807.1 signal peptide peptidase SppA [Deinococcus hopiensis KR-140]
MPAEKTRSPTRLSGITALIMNGRWAIKQSELNDIVTGFNTYLKGNVAGDDVLTQVREARSRRAEQTQQAQDQSVGVAILPMHGTIFPRGSMMVDLCGALDAHSFAARVRAAANDSTVASIVLDVDSGGGAVSGVDVAAEAVRYAATQKRVTAVVNTMACSAAYWIASGATEIVVTPAGEVGSIGVIGTHTDETAWLDEQGLKVTYVRSTDRKALGQSAEAMDGAVLEQWQSEITRIHDLFVADIAAGRSVTVATAKKWGTGDVWFGQEAVDAGLADSVGTLDSVMQDHLTAAKPTPTSTVRQGQTRPAGETPQEGHVILTVKDRTGKTHTIDTESATAQADAQGTVTGLETGAYEAGVQQQRELMATALSIEVNDLTAERLKQVREAAWNGAAYRADLESKVAALATSVYGAENKTALDRMARLAGKAEIEDLQGMVDDLTAQKNAKFPNSRLSVDAPEKPEQEEDTQASATATVIGI